jgi:hypothetical protein
LQEAQIYASTAKCKFFADRLSILGHYIDKDGIHTDPEKIRGIQDWPTPKSKKELQRFIGVVIYHAQFLPHLATITSPLSDLISQEVFEWHPIHEEAFKQVKRLAENTPILRPLDYESPDPIYLFTDASQVGAGAWVGQGPTPQTAQPAAFHSRKFQTSQLHYPVHELETLAIVDAVQAFHPLLSGAPFIVMSDNKSLSYFMKQVNLGNRLSRWRMFLQGYDFTIVHTAGKDNILADALSRIYEEREPESNTELLEDPTISTQQSFLASSPPSSPTAPSSPTLPQSLHMPSPQSPATSSILSSLSDSLFTTEQAARALQDMPYASHQSHATTATQAANTSKQDLWDMQAHGAQDTLEEHGTLMDYALHMHGKNPPPGAKAAV